MNDHSLDRILEAWLDVGPDVAPNHLHEAVAEEARATRQAPANFRRWIADSVLSMNTVGNLALAAAAVALAAVVGIGLMTMGQDLPGTSGPSVSPSPSPELTAKPTPEPTTAPPVDPRSADYRIGRHSLAVEGIRFSFDVPDAGWEPYGRLLIAKSESGPQGAEAIVYWTHYNWMTGHGETDAVACGAWSNQPDSSVERLVEEMSIDSGVELIEPSSDVEVGGRPAKHLVVRVVADLGCDPGYFFNWRAQTGGALWQMSSVGDTLSVWIFEEEPAPFFVVAVTNGQATSNIAEQAEEIVTSIRFE